MDNNMNFDNLLRTGQDFNNKTGKLPAKNAPKFVANDDSLESVEKNILLLTTSFKKSIEMWHSKVKDIMQINEMPSKTIRKNKENDKDDTEIKDIISKTAYPCLKRIGAALKKTGAFIINKTSDLFKFAWSILKSVAGFFVSSLKFLLGPAWNFIKNITTTMWNAMKGILKIGLTVVSWVFKIGMKIVEYIWKGVKAIFKFGFYVIGKIASYLWRGTIGFLKWWFNGIFSAILSLNPLSILFYSGMFLAFIAGATILLGMVLPFAQLIIVSGIDIEKTIHGWITDALKIIQDYLEKSPWIQSVLRTASEFFSNLLGEYFKEGTVLGNIIRWVGDVYSWLATNFMFIVDSISDPFKRIIKISEGGSLLKEFIKYLKEPRKFLIPWPNIGFKSIFGSEKLWKVKEIGVSPTWFMPGLSAGLKYLEYKLGFITGGRIKDLKEEIPLQAMNLVQQKLEHEIYKILSSKNITAEQKNVEINKAKIDERKTLEGQTLSTEQYNNAIKSAEERVSQIERGQAVLVPEEVIAEETKTLAKLTSLSDVIKSGLFNYTGANITEYDNIINAAKQVRDKATDARVVTQKRIKKQTQINDEAIQDFKSLDAIASTIRYFPDIIRDTTILPTEYPKDVSSDFMLELAHKARISGSLDESSKGKKYLNIPANMTIAQYIETEGKPYNGPIDNTSLTQRLGLNLSFVFGEVPEQAEQIVTEVLNKIKNIYDTKRTITEPSIAALKSMFGPLIVAPLEDINKMKTLENINLFAKKYTTLSPSSKESIRTLLINTYKLADNPEITHLAAGAILPNKTNLNNVIPLDSIGREYIREQVKNIKLDDNKKIKNKEDKSHITIIEENSIYSESYELYTMSQISKGILGV